MKPEQAEYLLIEELIQRSQEKGIMPGELITLIDKLTGDASTRRYYRLLTNKNSYVICLDNPHKDMDVPHTFLSKQQFLFHQGVKVPTIFDHDLAKGYLLEEDLGDTTLLHYLAKVHSPDEEREIYKKIIDQLIKIHSIDREKTTTSGLFNFMFDFEKFNDEMKFTYKHFFKNYLNVQDEKIIEKISPAIEGLCHKIAALPMVLTHRDFHSRNIMVNKNQFIIIDFQDARMGIPQYDLVSLLEDCYYSISPDNRTWLIKYYYDAMGGEKKLRQTWEQYCELYDLVLFQRVFKAIGSFSYIYATRKDVRYLKYIGFGMEKIRHMLMKYPRLTNLK
jgi:aminoglycoside/choline kinase family phosphotransferase